MFFTCQLGKHMDAGMQAGGQDPTVASTRLRNLSPGLSLAAQGAAMSLLIKTFCFTCTHSSCSIPSTDKARAEQWKRRHWSWEATQSWFVPEIPERADVCQCPCFTHPSEQGESSLGSRRVLPRPSQLWGSQPCHPNSARNQGAFPGLARVQGVGMSPWRAGTRTWNGTWSTGLLQPGTASSPLLPSQNHSPARRARLLIR